MVKRRFSNTNDIYFQAFHAFQSYMSTNRRRFNMVKVGRRAGKTFFVTEDSSRFLINKDKYIGWFAPQSAYFKNVYNEIIKKLAPIIESQNASDYLIKFINGSMIKFWSLENKNAGRGEKYHRVIIDEAGLTISRWEDVYIESILPTLTDYKGELWLVGTPKGKNQFYDLWQAGKNDDEWALFNATSYKNPYLDPEELEKFKHRMPKKSFEQEYLAEFVDALEMNIISEELFDRCCIDPHDIQSNDFIIGGYDVAENGEDKNAISIVKNNVLVYFDEWYGDDTLDTIKNSVAKVVKICQDYDADYLYFDAIGVGAGVGGYVPKTADFLTTPFKASTNPAGYDLPFLEDRSVKKGFTSNGEQFENRGSQSWWGLYLRMLNSNEYLSGNKDISPEQCFFIDKNIKNLPQLKKELTQAIFSEETGKIVVDKKPANKKSPNIADSLVIATSHWSYINGLQQY